MGKETGYPDRIVTVGTMIECPEKRDFCFNQTHSHGPQFTAARPSLLLRRLERVFKPHACVAYTRHS